MSHAQGPQTGPAELLAVGQEQHQSGATPQLGIADDYLAPDGLDLLESPVSPCDAHEPGQSPSLARSPEPVAEVPELPAELLVHPRYQILQLVGLGGMGAVYKAEHRLMGRLVALKVISRELIRDASAVPRFRQEVRAAARLTHPNIVTAFDAEEAGGCHFLVMEYVEGVNLARLVQARGPLSVARTCGFLRQAALGLQHAHAQGMVHRDIKPHNLMITPQGQIKILDFGLARFAREQNRLVSQEVTEKRITLVGEVIGTPDYLAPEQARDACGVDARADLYSLGCTAYFLLTGQVPFPADTALQKLFLHCEQEPAPVEALRPEVPWSVAEVVRKLMAKKPENRYQTAGEVALAFEPFTTPSARVVPVCPPPEPPPIVSAPAEQPFPAAFVASEEPLPPNETDAALLPDTRPRSSFPVVWAVVVGLLAALGFATVRGAFSRHEAADDSQASKESRDAGTRSRDRPRVLLLLASRGFARAECAAVRQALEQAGVEVVSTSTSERIRSDEPAGTLLEVDFRMADIRTADFDALVVGGGDGARELTGDGEAAPAARRLMAEMMQVRKPVAAIGMGTCVLADTGVLRGKRTACPDSARDRVVRAGCKVVPDAVDALGPAKGHGPLITARDMTATAEFTRALLHVLPAEDSKEIP
jgi:eukaryotic-like serine/threonine-protein kinase